MPLGLHPALLSLLTACPLAIAPSFATASPNERALPSVPAPLQKNHGPPDAELPLPYQPWDGTGLPAPPPPAERDESRSPLPRPREQPRRPFELTAAFTALLPSCGAGSVDSRGCASVHPGAGADGALLYRVNPFFAVGLEALVSGFAGDDGGPLAARGGRARFAGVVGRLYFAEAGAWDPYATLTLGVGSLELSTSGAGGERGTTTGLGGRVGGGIDYWLGARVRVGPSASFAHFVATGEQQCNGDVCRTQSLAYGRLLGFATLGLRMTASFGEVL